MNTFNISGGNIQFGDNNRIQNFRGGGENESPTETSWKTSALDLISEGKIKEALAETVNAHGDERTKTQVAQLLGRLSGLESGIIVGTISKNEENLEMNNIRNAVVTLISGL